MTAGDRELTLSGGPFRGNLHLRLEMDGHDGQRVVSRLDIASLDHLAAPRARRLIELAASHVDDGSNRLEYQVGKRCRRVGAKETRCQLLARPSFTSRAQRCWGVAIALLRPDGGQGYADRSRTACRRLRR